MISSKIEDGTLFIFVNGSFTINLFPEFQATYENKKFESVMIDFSNTDSIDSGGLGMLLQLRTIQGENANNITLKGVSKQILKVFEVVNFEKLFKMV
jgi:HptB-dependent secretion and biofilm anti anti-sigma factor